MSHTQKDSRFDIMWAVSFLIGCACTMFMSTREVESLFGLAVHWLVYLPGYTLIFRVIFFCLYVPFEGMHDRTKNA